MIRTFISLCVIVIGTSGPANADVELPTPNVISCLKAVEPLDSRYRGWMQPQCISVAGDICVNVDNRTGSCLPDLIESMRKFYDELMPLLPAEIEDGGLRARGYKRALERARDTFDHIPECDGLSDYEYITCEFIELGVATIDLFYRARLASVPLP